MSYRTINIHGTDYEYVIGKSNIHIKGFGDFPVKVHGNEVCSPKDGGGMYHSGKFIATPATVKALILGKETPVTLGESPNRTKYLMVNPFAAEIHEKTEYLPFDPEAYYRLSDDI